MKIKADEVIEDACNAIIMLMELLLFFFIAAIPLEVLVDSFDTINKFIP